MKFEVIVSLILGLLCSVVTVAAKPSPEACKCFPGDACWPSEREWSKFASKLQGQLIPTVPLGQPCHDPKYDSGVCKSLQDQWRLTPIHIASSSSVMAPLFANQSCDPFTPKDAPCTLGNYVSYAVNATGPGDIAATLAFAKERNIRLAIRNTGHDYLGRSTGAGALSIWTHHLKNTEILDWSDEHYTGKALKVGAGVQGFEALAAAREAGLVVVTGECSTVGLAGGYTQGGGHSALLTSFGLAADNTLEFEVVTPDGELLTASKSKNKDLYWALSGGGGGNYGVVVSLTVQAHPDAVVSGASFSVVIPQDDPDRLSAAVDAFHAALPDIVDSGLMVIYYFGPGSLQAPAMTAYGKTRTEVQAIMQPLVNAMEALGLNITAKFTEFPSYYEHFNNYWGPLPAGSIGVGESLFGGRLLPRSVVPDFSPTARKLVDLGVTFIGVGLNVTKFGGDGSNAVLPQWRNSLVQVSLTLPWSFEAPFEDMAAEQNRITTEIQPVIEAVTPSAGAYMNEADVQQPDFQDTFFGVNYPKLLAIKKKYDPSNLLYAVAGVGSEKWTVKKDGRMCRAAK